WNEKSIPTKTIIIVSHNVKEAVNHANRLIILNHDPGSILKEIPIRLLYPREETSHHFQDLVDAVYTTLLTTAEHVSPLKKGKKAQIIIAMDYKLPDISIHRLQGLMDALIEPPYHGK